MTSDAEKALRRKAHSNDFQKVIAYHRAWLEARNLLHRPWLILGAAPAPTIPDNLPPDIAFIHVKYAGHSAKKLGLPNADLTFLLGKTTPEQIDGLRLSHVLRMRRSLSLATRVARIVGSTSVEECEISHGERDRFLVYCLDSLFSGPVEQRPSNGVALVCYAVAVGVPQVVVAGISLDSDGYEYAPTARTRRHLAEDRQALGALAKRYPQVVTSEPGLSGHTGLPLFGRAAGERP